MSIGYENGLLVNLSGNVTKLGSRRGDDCSYFFLIRNDSSRLLGLGKVMELINEIEGKRTHWNISEVPLGGPLLGWARCSKGSYGSKKVVYNESTLDSLILFHEKTTVSEMEAFVEEVNEDHRNELRSLYIFPLELKHPFAISKVAPGFFAAGLEKK